MTVPFSLNAPELPSPDDQRGQERPRLGAPGSSNLDMTKADMTEYFTNLAALGIRMNLTSSCRQPQKARSRFDAAIHSLRRGVEDYCCKRPLSSIWQSQQAVINGLGWAGLGWAWLGLADG